MVTAVDIGVLALTSGGAKLAAELAPELKARVYLPQRLRDRLNETGSITYFENWNGCVQQAFQKHRGLVFIMAAGIVVRTLAPLLGSKHTDPAVVVMDEKGQFAISLLSGHRGGANELAGRVADICGAVPVITTATDVRGKAAVDVLAEKLNCTLRPLKRVKYFNRLLAEEEYVELYSQWPLPGDMTAGMRVRHWREVASAGNFPSVIVSNRDIEVEGEDYILLTPRNLVVGVGCRKGISAAEVISAVRDTFHLYKLALPAIKTLASVEIKKQERGLIEAAEHLQVPLRFVSREDIHNLAGCYRESEIVKQKIGVGAVCEPSAIHVSRGKLLVPKQKMGRVTVAVAEQPLQW
ncbi:cobalt-precorrin 5A hydrolase [Desulfohalotomaculum tongense]|uniref:cobalt-precorrin 5A hydrolase n=1 Tax=Desulforadius tongensis TaxID=1216062 RepID=UPI00195B676C|nr:cobalt-precorrin 5A hydrolase [Desulforadius tongensis]MBM7854341.1 cobalt-precorrin 5A hydrolase [Desulforadius tongensis]